MRAQLSGTDRMGDSKESDDQIVTETTILGVTESGVIRKRSVKRRISRDDINAAAKAERKYGNDKDDYAKLAERVLTERSTSTALDVLRERWRMIMYMYDDCMELVKQWDEQRLVKQHKRHRRRLMLLSFASLPFLLIIITWLLARWCW